MAHHSEKLKHSIFSDARKISREVGANLNVTFDADALDVVAELVWKKLALYASDLEAFQKHAKRSSITSDDVKLLVRRSTSLKELVDAKLEESHKEKPAAEPAARKKRKLANVS